MDDRRFDALTRAFARGTSRRTAIKGLFGGVVGGVAVTTRLSSAGAQPTPCDTVLDCPLDDTCTTAYCVEGSGGSYCQYFYNCGDGYCCPNGTDVGTCVSNDECCSDVECVTSVAVCSKAVCNDGTCEAVAGCADGQMCCDQGTEQARCAECCNDGDCTANACGSCFAGHCEYHTCCYPEKPCTTPCHTCSTSGCINLCGQSEECCGEDCVPIGTCCDGWGESCGYGGDDDDAVAAGDYQANCCDGLLCCDAGKGTHACYECCGDWDCPKGEVCAYGACAQCGDDSHCGKGEICCGGECVYGECCGTVPVDQVAAGGVDDLHACGPCEACYDNWCRSTCDDWEVCCESEPDYFECVHEDKGCCGLAGDWCQELSSADNLNGSCCDGLNCCYDDKSKSGYCAECCGDYDCQGGYCCDGVCQAECCSDKDCDWGVCVDGYCVECRDDWGCDGKKGEICCEGSCEHWECCGYGDETHCGDCGWCGENYQCYALAEYGEHCEILMVADGSPEGNCCHGLVCCEWDKGSVCAECCGDWDCPSGCECDHGVCSCHCGSDKDCAAGTCCCKSGACSADCCPKPPKPTPETPVTTLPATGSGDTAKTSGLFGAVALGAAALVAAKTLRQNPETSTEE